ncbi:hypothetical protein GS682_22565 [Nostoc sp. B(2019)]|uniref:Uncharacterized protein n=1 Tax=Nostoc cf. edaphicum LEGE 07299 TaxID=2777974 RepID=A0ABR9U072_9NOSO|nr:hypothetical protein [Nostoc edaphicum]MBE9105680.1 hypothetical protein [Nostoc cf. edaphicum LEGE 07299]NDJ24379.1 hypothetical protein [Nostoc sp. B(2019)]
MTDKQDLTPEKVRIKDSYRERIFAESQQLGKSYLETLYFIIDCYFAFRKGTFPTQQVAFTPINTESNQLIQTTLQPSTDSKPEDSDDQTFSLDFDL